MTGAMFDQTVTQWTAIVVQARAEPSTGYVRLLVQLASGRRRATSPIQSARWNDDGQLRVRTQASRYVISPGTDRFTMDPDTRSRLAVLSRLQKFAWTDVGQPALETLARLGEISYAEQLRMDREFLANFELSVVFDEGGMPYVPRSDLDSVLESLGVTKDYAELAYGAQRLRDGEYVHDVVRRLIVLLPTIGNRAGERLH